MWTSDLLRHNIPTQYEGLIEHVPNVELEILQWGNKVTLRVVVDGLWTQLYSSRYPRSHMAKEIYLMWDNWLIYVLERPGMYVVRNVWKCARGKVPECLEVVKEVRASWASDGNTTGKIHLDYTDRMDTITF